MTFSRPIPTSPNPESRHCIKCGREVGANESICEICNRAGMATPSASQYHGTIAVAIVLAVAGLAFAASMSLEGVGPYAAQVQAVRPADPGYAITYAVTNEGTKAGRAKCQLVTYGTQGQQRRVVNALSAQVAGGATSEETISIPGLDAEPEDVRISCS